MLTNLADSFQQFYDSGVEHYNSAIYMLSNMQEIGVLCNSSHTNTVSAPVQKVKWISFMVAFEVFKHLPQRMNVCVRGELTHEHVLG